MQIFKKPHGNLYIIGWVFGAVSVLVCFEALRSFILPLIVSNIAWPVNIIVSVPLSLGMVIGIPCMVAFVAFPILEHHITNVKQSTQHK